MWAGSEAVELEGCTREEVILFLLPHNSSRQGIYTTLNWEIYCFSFFYYTYLIVWSSQDEGTATVLWMMLQEWRTHIVKGSCNPLFGDQFSCILQEPKELQNMSLRMEVLHYTNSILTPRRLICQWKHENLRWKKVKVCFYTSVKKKKLSVMCLCSSQVRDFDKFSRHTVLGEVRVPLRQLNIFYPLELQDDLQIPQKVRTVTSCTQKHTYVQSNRNHHFSWDE